VAPQIEHIAHALAGPQSAERDVLDTARLAAMAELDLVRIRRIRSGLLKDLALSIAAMDTDTDETSVFEKVPVLQVILNGIQAELSATEMFNDLEKWERRSKGPPSSRVSVAIAELVRIERYERRPMSRRKRLFRALDVLRRGPDS